MAKRAIIKERLVFHIWDGQHLDRSALCTADRRRLVVRDPGRWNVDTGPDFEDAELQIDGQPARGDVEIHTKASGWYTHEHHLNPRYNEVVLHAVLWDDGYRAATVKQNGEAVPVLVMSQFLDESLEKLSKKMARLERSRLEWSCPRTAGIKGLDAHQVGRVLDRAARARWHEKVGRLRKRFEEIGLWEQVLYEGLMEALGYSKNKEAFRQLAQVLPLSEIEEIVGSLDRGKAAEEVRAVLFGVAGLLPSQSTRPVRLDVAAIDYIAELERRWRWWVPRFAERRMEPSKWQFFRLRPANFPTRRLAGMAQLLAQHTGTDLLDAFCAVAQENSCDPWRSLEQILTPPLSGYWRTHYHFGRSAPGDVGRAIGPDRARDMVVNVVLPVLWMRGNGLGDAPRSERIWDVYAKYPKLAENKLTRFLGRHVVTRQLARSTITGAMRQQGALQVYKTACDARQCEKCPFLAEGEGNAWAGFS